MMGYGTETGASNPNVTIIETVDSKAKRFFPDIAEMMRWIERNPRVIR
jgi:hypothetical protein